MNLQGLQKRGINFPAIRRIPAVLFLLIFSILITGFRCRVNPARTQDPPSGEMDFIKLPEGFHIHYFSEDVEGARSMVRGDKGTLFTGTRGQGNVYAIVDRNGDFESDAIYTIASGLNSPNGVAFLDGDLYVAEISRITRYDDIENHLENPPKPVVIYDKLPTDGHHGWKYLAFGPDGKLYVPVGAPCNVCKSAEIYSSLCRMNPDGTGFEIFASGIRNTVGFAWHPTTQEVWFTDNGRDWMGDDAPPDELNHAPVKGLHFGFPFCHGGNIQDPEFGNESSCDSFVPPAINLGAHVAALGMKFYTGEMFPEEYQNQIFIAEHGSWNRSDPTGYRVSLVRTSGNQKAVSYEVFAEGWLHGSGTYGRPVDILQWPDGSLLVSDDAGGKIYRIYYKE